VKWLKLPLEVYVNRYANEKREAPLTTSLRFIVCKIALQMGLSESQFYDKFDDLDRAQIIATYQTINEIEWVQVEYPIPSPKKGKG